MLLRMGVRTSSHSVNSEQQPTRQQQRNHLDNHNSASDMTRITVHSNSRTTRDEKASAAANGRVDSTSRHHTRVTYPTSNGFHDSKTCTTRLVAPSSASVPTTKHVYQLKYAPTPTTTTTTVQRRAQTPPAQRKHTPTVWGGDRVDSSSAGDMSSRRERGRSRSHRQQISRGDGGGEAVTISHRSRSASPGRRGQAGRRQHYDMRRYPSSSSMDVNTLRNSTRGAHLIKTALK